MTPLPSNTIEVPFDDGDYRYTVDDCPFCGDGEHLEFYEEYIGQSVVKIAVICDCCGARGPFEFGKYNGELYQKVVDKWNERKGEPRERL